MNGRIALLGYCNRLCGRPGDRFEFKVSSQSEAPFCAELVRVVSADPNPAGPGLIELPVEGVVFGGEFPSRTQPFYPGSYADVDAAGLLPDGDFTLVVNLWPTRPDHEQSLLSLSDSGRPGDGCRLEILLDQQGRLAADIYGRRFSLARRLTPRRWLRVWLSHRAAERRWRLGMLLLDDPDDRIEAELSEAPGEPVRFSHLTLAARASLDAGQATAHYDGKLEAPMLLDGALDSAALRVLTPTRPPPGLLAWWDFSRAMSSTRIEDRGPQHRHGRLHNLPARAMSGSNWDGSEMSWRHAPGQYGAIHFHADDIVDFGWQTDFAFTVPDHMASGVYAAKLHCGEALDWVPFFVCPAKDRRGRGAALAVLASTFTYSVYGNHARPDYRPDWQDKGRRWDSYTYPHNPAEHPEYGLSTYNYHADGSGICHASHRRPLFNLRPGYITFGNTACSGLRHFQADSHLWAWLEQQGIAYDIVTDQELHDDGVEALSGYRAVTTGSHPEYHTEQSLNALRDYRDQGGNLLYLGGNGFYWKVALHPQDPAWIEIRRAEGGIRAWAAEPGEYYQAFDGGYGGLWRRNGRPPQRLAAVGFSAQGVFDASYYRRLPVSYEQDFCWLFDGIDDDTLGDFGLSGGGAAGFELDRYDPRLGSPGDASVLARSERHGPSFVLVPEEQLTHLTTLPGEAPEKLIRADLVYHCNRRGGELFSVGSITFCGCLPVNGGDNNISRLLLNVFRRFLDRG